VPAAQTASGLTMSSTKYKGYCNGQTVVAEPGNRR
jgi:hypothetical protein